MTKQVVNVGATANDGSGDSLRLAMQKMNSNHTEEYAAIEALTASVETKVDESDLTIALDLKANTSDVNAALELKATTSAIAESLAKAESAVQPNAAALTGTPTAPTANSGTDTTQIATTAFVRAEIADLVDGAPSILDTLSELSAALGADANFAATTVTALGLKANASNAALTGTPTAPTASVGANTTQIATTAFVRGEVTALVAGAPSNLDTLDELAAALGDDPNFATTMTSALAAKAPLASPTLTGTPSAPTAALGTNTTQLATTAFLQAALAALTQTIKFALHPLEAIYPSANFAQFVSVSGTNFPVNYLAFDDTTEETVFFRLNALRYASGNVTVRVHWNSAAATTGGVAFGASLAAITPNTDGGSIETKAFATEVVATDTHLGTTAQRAHSFDIVVNNLDGLAGGDELWLRLARKVANAGDDMVGDCRVLQIDVEYTGV